MNVVRNQKRPNSYILGEIGIYWSSTFGVWHYIILLAVETLRIINKSIEDERRILDSCLGFRVNLRMGMKSESGV